MRASAPGEISADYLVVGAGAMGMAFTDTLVSETEASVVVVDREQAPGGHWTNAYPFVRLHQPSAFYGVNSRILQEKEKVLAGDFTALRQYLGYLLKYGYRFYGVPLPPVVDVDRPRDIQAAEKFLEETRCS